MKIELELLEYKVSPWGDCSTTDFEESDFKILIFYKGEEVGYGLFFHQNHRIYCQEVEVYSKFRRNGIATNLYNYAERVAGKSVRPTGDILTGLNESGEDALSNEGQRFWANRAKKN